MPRCTVNQDHLLIRRSPLVGGSPVHFGCFWPYSERVFDLLQDLVAISSYDTAFLSED